VKTENVKMAEVAPVIIEKSQPIINNTVYHCLEVQLVAKCVELKKKVPVL
jgi:hypothetical protein